MITKRSLTEKGQLVIPKDMREYLKWKNKEEVIIEVKNDAVIVKKDNSNEALERLLTMSRKKGNRITLEEIRKIEDESYDIP
ncbi:MAG: AbrB/MazE/SpoVT family DNA-binding domain-containing protein [Nanoarchaeota archaeon]